MKRGSLSISTNAIVILIIAVIMLGLIIGLVTRGFGAVERKFLAQIEDTEPNPSVPTSSNPITLSSSKKFASPGELVGWKVRIANTQNIALTVAPTVECQRDSAEGMTPVFDISTEQVFPKDIAVGQFEDFTYVVRVSDRTQGGVYLCRMMASTVNAAPGSGDPEPGDITISPAEFQIEVEN